MACALRPEVSEQEFARDIRLQSPTATPNSRLVEIGDRVLGRQGRMVEAVAAIGRGTFAYEGVPFALSIGRRG